MGWTEAGEDWEIAGKELKKAKACVAEKVPGNLTGNGKALCFGVAFFDRR